MQSPALPFREGPMSQACMHATHCAPCELALALPLQRVEYPHGGSDDEGREHAQRELRVQYAGVHEVDGRAKDLKLCGKGPPINQTRKAGLVAEEKSCDKKAKKACAKHGEKPLSFS